MSRPYLRHNLHRLRLHALTLPELNDYLKPDFTLETRLRTEKHQRKTPEFFEDIIHESILPAVERAGKDYIYFTLWLIIDKQINTIVGDLCFKGLPNKDGEIEVGYGIYPAFSGQGYMTRGLKMLINRISTEERVKAITAQTDKNNLGSHRVLEKNGFTPYMRYSFRLE